MAVTSVPSVVNNTKENGTDYIEFNANSIKMGSKQKAFGPCPPAHKNHVSRFATYLYLVPHREGTHAMAV
eukprot:6176570-Pleurochrysis_carterae.AAC.2